LIMLSPHIYLIPVLIAALIYDFRLQRIPNFLTYPTMALAIGFYSFTTGVDGLLFSAAGFALGIAILLPPYLMGGMGAGDAKLLGAVGAVLGPKGVFISFLYTALIGGVYAVTVLFIKRGLARGMAARALTTAKTCLLTQSIVDVSSKEENSPRLCYGVAIALGTMTYIGMDMMGYAFPF
jgi:prepilin peptidase CpaA